MRIRFSKLTKHYPIKVRSSSLTFLKCVWPSVPKHVVKSSATLVFSYDDMGTKPFTSSQKRRGVLRYLRSFDFFLLLKISYRYVAEALPSWQMRWFLLFLASRQMRPLWNQMAHDWNSKEHPRLINNVWPFTHDKKATVQLVILIPHSLSGIAPLSGWLSSACNG